MAVKDFDDAYVGGEKTFFIEYRGEQKKFIARELGYLQVQNIALQSVKSGMNGVALLVAASIEAESGEKFTYAEVLRLRKDIAQVFSDAAAEVNPLDATEKK